MGNVRQKPNHAFFVHLATAVAAVADGLDAQADIVDDDPIPSISVSDVTIGESASGSHR